MAKRIIHGQVYEPTAEEVRNYKSGIPPTLDSPIYKKVAKMSTRQLKQEEEQYYTFLQYTQHGTMASEIAYHKWFALRWEGENRGLWRFIPTPEADKKF